MRHLPLALVLLAALAGSARALTLDDLRVQATLVDGSPKDPFRIHARLSGVDARTVVGGFAMIRFGSVEAHAPAGAFVRRGNAYTWRTNLFGVKKVTINVRKGTLDVVGGGVDLGELPGPVRLAVGTSKGVVCGSVAWARAERTAALGRRRAVRKVATGPLAPCVEPPDGLDHRKPTVFITSPTPLPGTATTDPTIAIGGDASDDVGVVGLSWSSDRGGGASLAPSASWSVAAIPLAAGDNRITVTAVDAAGNAGSDTLDVTYNTNGIAFDGMPFATPEALVAATSGTVTLRQKIVPNPDLDPASVKVVEVADDGSETERTALEDKGQRQNGDDLAGDDVWSGLMGLDGGADATAPQRFRVVARTTSQPDAIATSPVVTVWRVPPVDPGAVQSAVTLADEAQSLFTGLLADGTDVDAALDQVALLARAAGARAVGASGGKLGAWWVTEDGLLGGMLGYDQAARRGGVDLAAARAATPSLPRTITSAPASLVSTWPEVGSRRTIVLAPYFADAEPLAVDGMLRGMQCPQYEVETYTGGEASADRFKGLEEYGLILIASHGDTLFDGIGDAYQPEWSWKSSGGQAVILTGTALGSLNLRRYETDLRLGRMAIFPGGVTGVLPTYFTEYSVRLPQSIVYAGACRTSADMSLASALLERGASAYLGYDGYVDSAFAQSTGIDLFTKLLAGQSLAQAFTPGQQDGGTPPATFTLDGDAGLGLATGPVVNRSFEVQSGFLASVAGFTVKGDGRIVGVLGPAVPTDGARMALVSTGLGLTTQSGSFEQSVCLPPLPPGATKLKLEYDWNFFSEEFLEYCGSIYQDYFRVTFGPSELQMTKVDDLCNDPGTTLTHIDDFAFDKGDVYYTGWKTQSVDVTAFAGTTATLKFAAGDVGDSIFDTAILVDNVRVVAE